MPSISATYPPNILALAESCRNTVVRTTKILRTDGSCALASYETNFSSRVGDLIDEWVLDEFDLGADDWTTIEDETGEYIACLATGRKLGTVETVYSNEGLMETHPRAGKHLGMLYAEAAE